MQWIKRGLALIAVTLVVIQFYRPARNASDPRADADSAGSFRIPDDVRRVLAVSCFDCHSNNTRYPWYAEIQPVGWWLAGHIRDAKRDLNFDELGTYRPRRRYLKLGQIEEQIREGEMPLPAYTLIHTDARLTPAQKSLLISWTQEMRDSLKAQVPPDSLERRSPQGRP